MGQVVFTRAIFDVGVHRDPNEAIDDRFLAKGFLQSDVSPNLERDGQMSALRDSELFDVPFSLPQAKSACELGVSRLDGAVDVRRVYKHRGGEACVLEQRVVLCNRDQARLEVMAA